MTQSRLVAKQLRVYAEMLRQWRKQPDCDAVTCVIEGLDVQADRIEGTRPTREGERGERNRP